MGALKAGRASAGLSRGRGRMNGVALGWEKCRYMTDYVSWVRAGCPNMADDVGWVRARCQLGKGQVPLHS